jgi:hypothetical protein
MYHLEKKGDDPETVFEVQADDTFPVADLFGNFDIVDTNSGSTYTGISGVELDVTTVRQQPLFL